MGFITSVVAPLTGLVFGTYRYRRLAAEIAQVKSEITAERARLQSAGLPACDAHESAKKLLESAHEAWRGRQNDIGWRHVQAARKALVWCIETPQLLSYRAEQLRIEADEKLDNWRKAAVEATLPDEEIGKHEIVPRQVQDAMGILQENSDNRYQKIDIVRQQLLILFLMLLATIVAIGLAVDKDWISFPEAKLLESPRKTLGVLLLGTLGGSLTAIITTARGGTQGRIPEIIGDRLFTILRPLLGAGSALAVVLFLETGLFDVSRVAVAAVAVAAGFTESLLSRAVSTVESRSG